MVDPSILAPDSVEKKMRDIVGKYFGLIEFFSGVDGAETSIKIHMEEAEEAA